jgi:hypothetical protein
MMRENSRMGSVTVARPRWKPDRTVGTGRARLVAVAAR